MANPLDNNESIDLLQAFTTWDGNGRVLERILANPDPALALLALEGLYRIENDVNSGQFAYGYTLRNVLRKWRCESPLCGAYSGAYRRAPEFLGGLTIFKTLELPLFIDDFGQKKLLSNYSESEYIVGINLDTPICHVTHSEEAEMICHQRQLKPSDNKNIIEGCWFGLDSPYSVYGSKSFKTTLSKLRVTGLHQGEIVSYTNEVNVILYAGDDPPFEPLKKPTDQAVKKAHGIDAYVHVSIFVPSRFLPSQSRFGEVIEGPCEVKHLPFCVKAKRSGQPCEEHQFAQVQAMFPELHVGGT